ncbi:MAG: neuraminidase-like domain-containing protein [Gammaproteobacteria bacterium]
MKDGKADRSALKDLDTFSRVYTAYFVMKKLGIPASALTKAATNEPNATTVRDLHAALRARYEESDWLNVLKAINDEMRALQRDALVAYILHQMRVNPDSAHIDTPDKLFEYFLMDVQMSPCMQTSRIRDALSSVQLFIERCLMNLEKKKVVPSSIKAKQWESMKRYRVWEANRKVFLWPENWLEPELRDDQSPFFKETMSELLQSDITEDSAAVALLNHLSKLDEVAKLEPCGIHYLENDLGTSDDIAHVVARTAGANRKYFYRRREYGYWTPWEQIKLAIEDNPVIPVVWKGRLFLFWIRILKKPPKGQTPGNSAIAVIKKGGGLTKGKLLTELRTDDINPDTRITVKASLCWSEYYNGKWQPTKTSDVNRPTTLGQFAPDGFDRSKLRLSVEESAVLRVFIDGGEKSSSFFLYNTHSLPVRQEDYQSPMPLILIGPSRYEDTSSSTFMITYSKGFLFLNPDGTVPDHTLPRSVLKNQIGDRTIEPRHYLQNVWDAPFFYEDSRHVFYVTTTEELVTIPKWNWYFLHNNPAEAGFNYPSSGVRAGSDHSGPAWSS